MSHVPLDRSPNEVARLALREYVISATAEKEALAQTCRVAAHVCHAQVAVVTLTDGMREQVIAESRLRPENAPPLPLIGMDAVQADDLIVLPDIASEPQAPSGLTVALEHPFRFHAGGLLRTPLGYVIGAIRVFDNEPRPDGFAPEQAEALRVLAKQVISLLEQKRLAVALEQREIELKQIYSIARIGTLRVDLLGGFKNYRSPEYLSLHGLSPESAQESHEDWVLRIHPADRERVKSEFERAVAGTTTQYEAEYRIVRPSDGQTRWIAASATIDRDAHGAAVHLLGVHRDITEQKQTEAVLRGNEQRLRNILDTMPQIVWSNRPDGYHDYFNQQWVRLTGKASEESAGDGWNPTLHPDDQERAFAKWRHSLATGAPYEIEYRLRTEDGTYRWFIGRALPIRSELGEIERWFGTCTDIDDLKRAESTNAQLAAIVSSTGDAVISISAEDRRVQSWNRAAEVLFGYTACEAIGAPATLLLPKDHHGEADNQYGLFDRALQLGHVSLETVRRRKDGSLVEVSATAARMEHSDGRVLGVSAVFRDITERKKAESQLRASEERLRLALDASQMIGTWVWDIRTDAVIADTRFARLYGVDVERAASGAPVQEFISAIHSDDRARVTAEIADTVKALGSYETEYRVVQSDGSVRWVAARGRCEPGPDGMPARFPGSVVDITERKQVEEARELLSAELSHRIKNIFTIVNGLVTLTSRDRPEAKSFVDGLRNRLQSLAQAHEYVMPSSYLGDNTKDKQTLRGLISALLEPYFQEGRNRFTISGDDVAIGDKCATAFALIIHEQATNAVKYGSLSSSEGRVLVTGKHDGPNYRLTWQELGGPPVSGKPERKGFGTLLAERSASGQLGGELVYEWTADGLRVSLQVPTRSLSR